MSVQERLTTTKKDLEKVYEHLKHAIDLRHDPASTSKIHKILSYLHTIFSVEHKHTDILIMTKHALKDFSVTSKGILTDHTVSKVELVLTTIKMKLSNM